jgi:hypothetical protein
VAAHITVHQQDNGVTAVQPEQDHQQYDVHQETQITKEVSIFLLQEMSQLRLRCTGAERCNRTVQLYEIK